MGASAGRSLLLTVALFVPAIALAQVDLKPTPAPTVTAESTSWYQVKAPIIFGGNTYYPAGAQIFFNGNEMVRSGYYQSVPVYTRTTEAPFSRIYVPLPGNLLQPYERRREGELAGTVGTSTPSFPVERSSDPVRDATASGPPQASGPPTGLSPLPSATDAPSATGPASSTPGTSSGPQTTRAKAPSKRAGVTVVYIEYGGRKWYSNGPTVEFSPSRFKAIGEYHGLPVYADRKGTSEKIYIPVEQGADSLLAPYSRRR
jgi:hypothetical protein